MRAGHRPDEGARLDALRAYEVIDTPRESDFDEIVALAAQICGTPISLISLVEADRQWFKASVGTDHRDTDLETSICAHAILEGEFLEIGDAALDVRTVDNPLVSGDPNVRFYAGVPLKTPEGLPLGTLCVLDTVPRELTDAQRNALRVLGHQVMTQLELRRKVRQLEVARAETERAREAAESAIGLFRSVTHHLPMHVVVFDRELRYLYVNAAFERATGMTQADVQGRRLEEPLIDGIAERIRAPLTRALAGETFVQEFEIPYLAGLRNVRTVFVPDLDPAGNPQGVIAYTVDFTDELRTQRQLAKERARLGELLDKAPAFTALLEGPDLTFTFVNEEYQILIGHRDPLGLPLRKALPEVEGQGYFETMERVYATGEPFAGDELPVKLQRGLDGPLEERFINVLYQAMFDEDHVSYGVFAHGVDVTSQVLARKAVAEREELFRTVFEQAPDDAIVVIDANRRITAWNPAAERMTGWSAAEAVGSLADLIFTPEDQAAGVPKRETDAAAANGKASDERWHMRKGGERFWGSGTMNSLHDSTGAVRGYLKVFRDATERHDLMQRIETLNEELEAKVTDRTVQLQQAVTEAEAFNYSISHDLRTPLRAMSSTSQILIEEMGEAMSHEHRELLERQAHNAVRLGKLIDELLRLSRLARAEIHRQPLDMTAVARAVAGEIDSSCVVEVQEGMTAQGDPGLVRAVLQNLVGNACKFSPRGGKVEVGQTGDAFWVRDEGIGFDMAHATRMFLPFERLVADEEYPGTGIGLANVERIVRRHGGRVWAESTLGHGATFSFTLG